MQTIGERIKEIRLKNNMTQADFANTLGVVRTHITNIENAKSQPSRRLILLISILFQINEDWIKAGAVRK